MSKKSQTASNEIGLLFLSFNFRGGPDGIQGGSSFHPASRCSQPRSRHGFEEALCAGDLIKPPSSPPPPPGSRSRPRPTRQPTAARSATERRKKPSQDQAATSSKKHQPTHSQSAKHKVFIYLFSKVRPSLQSQCHFASVQFNLRDSCDSRSKSTSSLTRGRPTASVQCCCQGIICRRAISPQTISRRSSRGPEWTP